MIPRCLQCGAELVELGPDGVLCTGGHWFARDPETGALVPEQTDEPALASPHEERGRRSQADRLIGYALASGARFVVDQYGQPHAVVGSVPYLLPRGAYPWLRRLMWEREQRGVTGEALQTAAGTLEALALHQGERVELHVRSAWHQGTLYVWLGPGRILQIDASGWRVLHDAPVLFRQYPTLLELPDPTDGTPVDGLADCLDLVAPQHAALRRLVTAWIALAWLPHIARPMLPYTGDWGSGKTLRQRVIKRLLDPTKPESIRLDARELIQKLMHCQIALLDNLRSLPEWAIDSLCRAVTGEGDAKRQLYTDDSDIVYEYRRAILLNGINLPADRPDFTDRLLPVELERIPDDRRQEEAAIWARFAERHAAWLGALATLLSRAMAAYPEIRPTRLPRLADWGRWAMAVYEATGWGAAQFSDDWALVVERQQSAAIEGSPVALTLLRWIEGRDRWQGTTSQLLSELAPAADELNLTRAKCWPKSPVWLSRRLRELRPLLQDRGVVVTQLTDGHRSWVIERMHTDSEKSPYLPSAMSVASEGLSRQGFSPDSITDSKRVLRSIASALPSAQDSRLHAETGGKRVTDAISGTSSEAMTDDCRPPRCRCGGVLVPAGGYEGWLRCQQCRQFVRANDPALTRQLARREPMVESGVGGR